MTVATPDHVALVNVFEMAVRLRGYNRESDPVVESQLNEARSTLLDALALAQPALAAPVPMPMPGSLNAVAALMRTIDAYAFDYQKDGKLATTRGQVLAEIGTALAAQQPTPAASPAPCFYTVFARHESGGEVGWTPLAGSSNQTVNGVKNWVLETSRLDGYKGTVGGYLLANEWEIRPVFESPVLAQVMQPVEASQAKHAHNFILDIGSGIMICTVCGLGHVAARAADRRAIATVAAPVAPSEIERLAKVAIRECPWKPNQHPNDWSDAALQVCRAVVSGAALSAAKPELSDAQITDVLYAINEIAEVYDRTEYGLPMHKNGHRAAMVEAVRAALLKQAGGVKA